MRVGDGLVGQGEAAPVPGHSPESADDAWRELSLLGPSLELSPPGGDVRGWLAEASARLRTSSARFALESALLDWAALVRGVPASILLGGVAATEVPLAAVVPGPPEAWPAQAARLVAAGYRHLKIKVDGAEPESARDAFSVLRRSIPDVALRLDFNRTLRAPAAVSWIADLLPEFVEEPGAVPLTRLPLALDESLVDDPRWRELVAAGTYRVVVVKPSVVGGMAAALRVADEARALGARVVVSYGWETVVGWSAACAVSRALGPDQLAAGLAPHAGMSAPKDVSDGRLRWSAAPGLGLEGPA